MLSLNVSDSYPVEMAPMTAFLLASRSGPLRVRLCPYGRINTSQLIYWQG